MSSKTILNLIEGRVVELSHQLDAAQDLQQLGAIKRELSDLLAEYETYCPSIVGSGIHREKSHEDAIQSMITRCRSNVGIQTAATPKSVIDWEEAHGVKPDPSNVSDGSTASYYELPEGCAELQDLISHRNMNSQIGEIFRACYRYGIVAHSECLRDAKKIKFYAEAEIARLEKLNG